MSIHLMAAAFLLDVAPAQKLALLKLCDCADDDGSNAFPSVATLAQAASVSERHAQRLLRELVEAGLLVVQAPASRYRPTTYRISLPKHLRRASHSKARRGDTDVTPDSEHTENGPNSSVNQPVSDDEISRGDADVTPDRTERGRGDIGVTPEPIRGDMDVAAGVTSEPGRGDTGVVSGVTSMSPDPPMIRPEDPPVNQRRETRAREAATGGRRPEPGALTPLIGCWQDGHAKHAACDPTRSRCVPDWLHRRFVDALAPAFEGDRQVTSDALRDWYPQVWATLPADFVMPDAPKFWQPQFDAAWASDQRAERPISARELDEAKAMRRRLLGCPHSPRCDSYEACLKAIVLDWRAQGVMTA